MKRLWLCAVLAAAPAWGQPAPSPSPPSGAKPPAHVIKRPVWDHLPSNAQMAGYFPVGANQAGKATMECDVTAAGSLTGCTILSEYPPGKGFGAAELKMAHLFHMKPETKDGVPVGGGVALIPMVFQFFGAPSSPSWKRPPSPEEMLSVWPAGAPDRGGQATLECFITHKGEAKNCHVLSEAPAHSGFGAAAVKLSPRFQIIPGQSGDKPTDTEAQLTLSFYKPQPTQYGVEQFGDITELHNAPWQAAPTAADMAAAWPAAAPAGLDEAVARVQCGFSPDTSLTRCKLLSEDPAGDGFGAAALALTERFRTRGALMSDDLLAKARIILKFHFINPKTGSAAPAQLTKPNWVSFIPADRMTQLYPDAAAKAGIKTGRGVVDCVVSATGALTGCSVVSEDPAGEGFGQAALAAIQDFAVNPWTEDGQPVDGARIRAPIRFVEAEPPPPPTAQDGPPKPPTKAPGS